MSDETGRMPYLPDCMPTRCGGKVPHAPRTRLDAIVGYREMLQEEADDVGEQALSPDLQKVNAPMQPGFRPTTMLSYPNETLAVDA